MLSQPGQRSSGRRRVDDVANDNDDDGGGETAQQEHSFSAATPQGKRQQQVIAETTKLIAGVPNAYTETTTRLQEPSEIKNNEYRISPPQSVRSLSEYYEDFVDDEEMSEEELEDDGSWQKSSLSIPRFKLINVYASLLSFSLSLGLVSLGIHYLILKPHELSSAMVITSSLAILSGSVSMIAAMANVLVVFTAPGPRPYLGSTGKNTRHATRKSSNSLVYRFAKKLRLQFAKHSMLHLVMACLSILAFQQKRTKLALLFLLHLIPACLFHVARRRREHLIFK